VNELAALGVATVYEASGQQGLVDPPLLRLVPGSRAAGPARTVRCAQDDNLGVHLALDRIRPGEVLVAVMPRPAPVALVGGLLAEQAKARGAVALLVDAAVRDSDELAGLGLPVWARWCACRGAVKRDAGELDVPVEVGGVVIAPGDVVVLDGDGAVRVPARSAGATLLAARRRMEKERDMVPQLRAGRSTLDLLGLETVPAGSGGPDESAGAPA
jgi:4-hydroxy-4-methyl-2-oxoglutarate aldolase